MKKIFVVVVLMFLVAGSGYLYWRDVGKITASDAVVEGRLVSAGVRVSGVVDTVFVAVGEHVTQGQPLFALNKSGYEMQLAKERIRLAEVAYSLPGDILVASPTSTNGVQPGKPLVALKSMEDEARKAVEIAAHVHASAAVTLSRLSSTAPAEYAQINAKRQAAVIARDEAAFAVQKAKDAYEKASYARAQREAQDKAANATGMISAALAARIAEYQAQISRVHLAEQSLAATVVTAPETGRVLIQTATPGMGVKAGDTPVTILPENSQGLWVTAFFSKNDGAGVAQGQECVVTFPDNGGKQIKGQVGTVLPVLDGEKNIAVRVILDQYGESLHTAVGQSVLVTIHTRGEFSLPGNFFGGVTKK